MREFIDLLVFGWCCAWWTASIYFFVSNWKRHEKKFGYLHIPVVIFTGVFSPGLVIVETAVSLGKWIVGKG